MTPNRTASHPATPLARIAGWVLVLGAPCLAFGLGENDGLSRADGRDRGSDSIESLLQDPAPDTESDEARARAKKRFLHLADGRVLRIRCRWNGETWEIAQDREYVALPPGAVTRAATEKEIESQAKRLERDLEPGDSRRRTALAQWMMREGLREEAFKQLDIVLEETPDEPGAIEMLREHEPRVQLPIRESGEGTFDEVTRTKLIRTASGSKPALQEIIALRLGRRCDPTELHDHLLRELHSPTPQRRAFCARALRRALPGQAVKALINRSILDVDEDVRRESALALREIREEGVILPALRALESEHGAIRANAIDALGTMGFAAAVEPLVNRLSALNSGTASNAQSGGTSVTPASNLYIGRQIAYVMDYDVEIAQAASIADPIVGVLAEGVVLDVRVHSVTATTVRTETRRIRNSLGRLTNQNPGNNNKAWLGWWEDNKPRYARSTAPTASPDPISPRPPRLDRQRR